MSWTVTLRAWWIAAYLTVGAALYLPLEFATYRQSTRRQHRPMPFPRWLWITLGHDGALRPTAIIGLWPLALREALR